MRDKRYFSTWERRGYHVTPVNYYSAVPNVAELEETLWSEPRLPAAVDLRDGAQLELLDLVSARYRNELSRFPREAPTADCPFFLNNRNFFGVDAEMLYVIVRDHRPRRIIEIGSGFSTLLSSLAIERNKEEDPLYECQFVAIEPFPRNQLFSQCKNLSELIELPVQKVPLGRFGELGANDILFIDSSHVSRLGSDVNFELLEIVPRLRSGVLIHVHDIFIPFEYPKNWAIEEGWFWNEQYMLEAFLSFNRCFEIVWAGSYMHWKFPERVAAAFGPYEVTPAPPASLWMRRVAAQ